jgi:hypothetical protein
VAATFVVLAVVSAYATGEILVVRAPEEVIGGDDVSVLVTTSPREENIDRSLVMEVPDSWTLKRAYSVESGAEFAVGVQRFAELQARFSVKPARAVLALADTASDFDPDAAGVAYFVVFSTRPVPGQAASQPTTVKAALVERINPDSPPELDKKTKKPKERNTEWRMVYPPRIDWSFDQITTRRVVQPIQLVRVARSSRALFAEHGKQAAAELRTAPEALQSFFAQPFSIGFWARTTRPGQPILTLSTEAGESVSIGTSLFGTAGVTVRERSAPGQTPHTRTLLGFKATIVGDGAWHHIVLSRDSLAVLRLFVDAQTPVSGAAPSALNSIAHASLGDQRGGNEFALDEMRFSAVAFRQPSDFERTIATAARDTSQALAALFHFDEYADIARSSIPFRYGAFGQKPQTVPMYWQLDSNAQIAESTSPVQFDAVLLTADMISPTQVMISWRAATEVGVKQYVLERRVGTYGAFEKILTVEAKHGVRTPKRGSSIIARSSYSATEELPRLNGDIELYYRLASVGFSEKDPVTYSEPIKLEYGTDRDVFVEQNDPNPFNPVTKIAFRTTKPTNIRLSIFDIIGREVAVLFNGKADPGRHTYTLDATNWPGGIYFYKVRTPRTTVTRKMVLAK